MAYSELARKAQEQVNGLEEPFRTAAFQTILNDLIQEAKRKSSPEARTAKVAKPPDPADDPVELILTNKVDGSKYAGLFATRGKLLEKSLAVLKIAKDGFGIDGLTAPQVTEVLVKKFRVAKVHRPNVSTELSKATEYVTRVKANDEYKYLLMSAGEQHLAEVVGR